MTDTPTLCRLEMLGPDGWQQAHHGINLLYPHRYPERLAANGKVGRVIILDTGEVIEHQPPPPCSVCDAVHSGPDGSCLL